MGFWDAKVICDHCNRKTKAKTALYRRGSSFCSESCIAGWEQANPPPVARGDEASLRKELAILLDVAITEGSRFGPGLERVLGQRPAADDLSLGAIASAQGIEEKLTAYELFQTNTLRAAPVLRALGMRQDATRIDSHNFLADRSEVLVQELRAIRARL